MSLDVSEPDIAASYADLLRPDGPIDWFILGHGGTSTKLFLLDSGNGGLEELRARLVATEVLYGLLKVQDRILLWSQIPDGVGGIKRAQHGDRLFPTPRLSSADPSNSPTNGTAPHAFPASSAPATASSAPRLMPHSPSHPEDEWRRQTHSRPSSPLTPADSGAVSPGLFESAAAAMLVSSPSDPSVSRLALPVQEIPVDVVDEDGSVARAVPAPLSDSGAAQPDTTSAQAHAPETEAVVDEVEQKTRALEIEKREDAARLEREKREREAEAAARAREEEERRRADAEAEYRRQAEEELEREQAAEEARRKAIEEKARLRAEEEERQRAAAEEELARAEEEARLAEAQRVLEQQRIEEDRRRAEEAEKARLEEEERTRKAEEEMRLLIERQRAEKQLREEEEARDAGEVMLSGTVNVQGGGSMLWRRRYFRLRQTGLELYKSESDTHTIVDSVAIANIDRITNPEEALVPHSFKLTLKDEDEWLFYYNTAEETEALVEALQCAMRR
ncbi:hypothetical protein Rhopal_004600-T1 [Rhodotorula paludigena]|uniref:PH domain-containing protein n=1 Tax=Rhodotorula paludigena TaxID=86838 RepID=A0AAV5GQ04_9BASI|nr:hypothetical protein Rhopal_004600-T1 [Rhodotorula paludigena]